MGDTSQLLVRRGAFLLTFLIASCASWFDGGRDQRGARNIPDQPLTWSQFVDANKGRGLSMDTLQRRFRVADADQDCLLTPEEIERHRTIAARNKEQDS